MSFAWLDPPRVVAHRGAPFEATENTLASFEAAFKLGARAIELDARLSRDGVVVVHHDAELGRALEGRGAVEALDARALVAAGAPTLEDVLRALPAETLFDVELKADAWNAGALPEKVAEVARAHGALDRVLVTSFDADLAVEYGAAAGRPVGWIVPFPVAPEDCETYEGVAFVALAEDAAVEGTIEALRAGGVAVLVWTVNDAAAAIRCLDRGASSVITDRPGALVQALRPRGASAP